MTDQPPGPDPTGPGLPAVTGRVLDAPAVLDLATGATEYMAALAYLATIRGNVLAIPATALVEAARLIDPDALDRLRWVLATAAVIVVPLDETTAFDAAEASRQLTHRDAVVVGHVAATATARRWAIVTDDDHAGLYRKSGHRVDVLP